MVKWLINTRLYKCGEAAAAFMDVKGYYLLMLLPFTAIIQQTGNCFYFDVWSRQTDTNPELLQLQLPVSGSFMDTWTPPWVCTRLFCQPFCFGGGSCLLKWPPLDTAVSLTNVCKCVISSRKAWSDKPRLVLPRTHTCNPLGCITIKGWNRAVDKTCIAR